MAEIATPNNVAEVMQRLDHLDTRVDVPACIETLKQALKKVDGPAEKFFKDLTGWKEQIKEKINEQVSAQQTAMNEVSHGNHTADDHHNLGTLLMQAGNHKDAMAQFENALGKDPNHAQAMNDLGYSKLVGSKLGLQGCMDAIPSLEKACQVDPSIPRDNANFAQEIMIMKSANEANADGTIDHNWMGVMHIRLEDFDAAKQEFLKVPNYESNPEVLNNLAFCYLNGDQDFNRAAECLISAYKINPCLQTGPLLQLSVLAGYLLEQA